jgi:hypothetical protein
VTRSTLERPRITLVLLDREDYPLSSDVFESLGAARQVGAPEDGYEVIVVADPDRAAGIAPFINGLGVAGNVVPTSSERSEPWWLRAADAARGDFVALVGAPGLASSTLVSSLFTAVDCHPDEPIVVRTFDLVADAGTNIDAWFRAQNWPDDGQALVRRATLSLVGDPLFRWLDVVDRADNVVLSRSGLVPFEDVSTSPMDVSERARKQLLGDGFVRVHPSSSAVTVPSPSPTDAQRTDPLVRHLGRVTMPNCSIPSRPVRLAHAKGPRLSVIVVVYNMAREAPRTLLSLSPLHQRGIAGEDYEVIVVDNGSKVPLPDSTIHAVVPGAAYYALAGASPSPARAINYGVSRANGEALAILVDGACLVSPGVLAAALSAYRVFPSPIVVTRYFFLGPGDQADTTSNGYDQAEEDRLLSSIAWPSDGYRLFEVAAPIEFHGPSVSWLSGWFESNCLFVPRAVFDAIGGCDERFDLPGGGLLITDLLLRAGELEETEFIQLLGEGTFHQVHGGVTTNTTRADRERIDQGFVDQYAALRGKLPTGKKSWFFLGRLQTPACRKTMLG